MKRVFLFCMVFLVLVPLSTANTFVPQNIGYLDAKLTIKSEINSSSLLKKMNHSLYIVPPDYSQIKIFGPKEYFIEEEAGNKKMILSWSDFSSGNYTVRMRVKNQARFSNAERTDYPYSAPQDKWKYLQESENVIIAKEIRALAKNITSGSQDSFEVVSDTSDWIYSNIEYDLDYGGFSLDSEKVYNLRKGTCDEFTNLFLAMARSAGIPARYVSGITYAKGGWGYHAWAEVYLDGWIPVDPTWNEVGWLDAAHIKFGSFLDSEEVRMETNFISSEDSRIKTKGPFVSLDILDSKPIENKISLTTETYPKEIGFGDSAVTEASLKTRGRGCLAVPVQLIPRVGKSGAPILSISPSETKITLCPGEEKKTHFLLSSKKELDKGYVYYNLGDIKPSLGNKTTVDLKINPRRKEDSPLIVNLDSQRVEEGDKIEYEISSDSEYRTYSDLPIKNKRIFAKTSGSHYFIVSTKTGEVVKKRIDVRENLNLKIKKLEIPTKVVCGQNFNISLFLESKEKTPLEITIKTSEDLKKINSIDETLEGEERFVFPSMVYKNCSGANQFVDITINDQKTFQKIGVEKKENPFLAFIRSLIRLPSKINFI